MFEYVCTLYTYNIYMCMNARTRVYVCYTYGKVYINAMKGVCIIVYVYLYICLIVYAEWKIADW